MTLIAHESYWNNHKSYSDYDRLMNMIHQNDSKGLLGEGTYFYTKKHFADIMPHFRRFLELSIIWAVFKAWVKLHEILVGFHRDTIMPYQNSPTHQKRVLSLIPEWQNRQTTKNNDPWAFAVAQQTKLLFPPPAHDQDFTKELPIHLNKGGYSSQRYCYLSSMGDEIRLRILQNAGCGAGKNQAWQKVAQVVPCNSPMSEKHIRTIKMVSESLANKHVCDLK